MAAVARFIPRIPTSMLCMRLPAAAVAVAAIQEPRKGPECPRKACWIECSLAAAEKTLLERLVPA